MKIAIIGAGFSGLATAYYLLQNQNIQVDLFDPEGIGGKSSKIAAGLLHKYCGPFAKLSRFGREGFAATESLIKKTLPFLDKSPIMSQGILRLCHSKKQEQDFEMRCREYPELKWILKEEVSKLVPYASKCPALFIPDGLAIDCQSYLKGLWLACQKQGANLFEKKICSLSELKEYAIIVVAMGADAGSFSELAHLKITKVKGQLLEFSMNKAPLLPLNSEAYLLKSSLSDIVIGGATFERDFNSEIPDLEKAKDLLLPKLAASFPDILQAKISNIRAGMRASTPGHLPVIGKFGPNLFAITGMGSKGLLYHAFFAKKLSEMILATSHFY